MTDIYQVIRDFLVAQPALVTTFQGRIWGKAEPPEGYDPMTDGVGCCFNLLGGRLYPNIPIWKVTFQFRVYGPDDIAITDADLLLVGALHQKKGGKVLMVLQEGAGQLTPDTQTDWPAMFSTFGFTIRNT